MSRNRMGLEAISRRQGVLIQRINHHELRRSAKRISLYDMDGKYSGWVGKKDFTALRRDSQGGLKVNKHGFVQVKAVRLERQVKYKTPVGSKRANVVIDTYTRTQRRLVVDRFRKGVLPVPAAKGRKSPFSRLKFSMDKVFGRLGLGMVKLERGT